MAARANVADDRRAFLIAHAEQQPADPNQHALDDGQAESQCQERFERRNAGASLYWSLERPVRRGEWCNWAANPPPFSPRGRVVSMRGNVQGGTPE